MAKEGKESKMKKVDASDLVEMEAGSGVDVSEFEGRRVDIEGYEVVELPSDYDPETGKEDPKAGYTAHKIRVFSKPVTTIKDSEGKEVAIRASELFGMKYDAETDKWGVSTSPKSFLNKFLAKCGLPPGLEGVKQLGVAGKGKQSLVMKIVKKGENEFLGFIY